MGTATKHFSHDHDLTFYEESEEIRKRLITKYNCQDPQLVCDGCRDKVVNGPAYFCQFCDYYVLHKSCFELPIELKSIPLHTTDHPLILRVSNSVGFVCNCCRDFWDMSFTYSCGKCRINLDISCALQTKKSSSDHHQSRNNNLVTEVDHFLDPHKLVLLYIARRYCTACSVLLSSDDASYGCLQCSLFLHKSCLEVPQVIQHPYHPHPLEASWQGRSGKCVACKTFTLHVQHYKCSEESCKFDLHMPCANSLSVQTTPLRLNSDHHHKLYCFAPPDFNGSECKCDKCDQLCEGVFYVCLECEFNVHPQCILPPKVDHECHSHPLTLKDSFREDDSGVYYCYACGEPRNGNYPLYFCEECPEDVPYTAHIECIISDDQEEDESLWKTSRQIADGKDLQVIEPVVEEDVEGEQKGDLNSQIHEIGGHDHVLTFHANEGLEVMKCYECKTEIQGGKMYTCQFCHIHLHLSCTNFPYKITRHRLHRHPLINSGTGSLYMCGLCRNICTGIRYECCTCSYALDVECAFLSNDQYENLKEKHPEVKIQHFSHPNELTLANCSSEHGKRCEICQLPISGSTYCEGSFRFFLHESCLEMKLEIQPSYHLPHRLFAQSFYFHRKICTVCKLQISYVGYSCSECQFFLHVKCATTLTSSLKLEFHEHNLYSFVPCDLWFEDDEEKSGFHCYVCDDTISGSFYRCVECDLSIHFECIPLPRIVKHSCHGDPLSLRSSFMEDDSGVYVCYVCGEPRNPNHPVYLCEECWTTQDHVFVAHLGCVIDEGDTTTLEV